MLTQAVRQQIDSSFSAPGYDEALRERLHDLAGGKMAGEEEANRMLALLREYVERAPDLLDGCAQAALSAGVAAEAAPILELAARYFLEPHDHIPDHAGLYGLLDDAYLAHAFIGRISTLYQHYAGVPLLPFDSIRMNGIARAVIGEPIASQLDRAVEEAVGAVLVHVRALAQGKQQLEFSRTGGPGAWGGTWEDEMARVGAECGISINYW